ncbi:MAG: hypothetical protein AAB407_02905 [Patescibacteria group bacterium]
MNATLRKILHNIALAIIGSSLITLLPRLILNYRYQGRFFATLNSYGIAHFGILFLLFLASLLLYHRTKILLWIAPMVWVFISPLVYNKIALPEADLVSFRELLWFATPALLVAIVSIIIVSILHRQKERRPNIEIFNYFLSVILFVFIIFSITSYQTSEESKLLQQKAIAQNDISLCFKIHDPSSSATFPECVSEVVRNTGDSEACKLLKGEIWQGICYNNAALQTKNSDICLNVGKYTIRACYINLAVQEHDPSLCNNLTNLTDKDGCFDSVAALLPDISVCEFIEQERKKETCLKNTAMIIEKTSQ